MKHALVFGGSGQAGSYLVEQLLTDGYKVTSTHHSVRRIFENVTEKNHHSFYLEVNGPLAHNNVRYAIKELQPDVVFNLIGELFAPDSWNSPQHYFEINGGCVLTMLETIRRECPEARFVNAGSAEMFGIFQEDRVLKIYSYPQPRNPYGIAKHMAYETVRMYREEKGLKCCTAIFFNMESPRRADFFFAQKVAKDVVKLLRGEIDKLEFGPLSAVRDWGWAPDYMKAMRIMADKEQMKDYIIATGESHSCLDFVHEAASVVGCRPIIVEKPGGPQTRMYTDITDTAKNLGWEPEYKFKDIVRMLVEAEMKKEKTVTA